MKKQSVQELHEKTTSELLSVLAEFESELGKSKIEHSIGRLQSPASLRMLRKQIARVKTILSEKE